MPTPIKASATQLRGAAARGDYLATARLLRDGAKPTSCDNDGRSALSHAVRSGCIKTTSLLIPASNLNEADRYGGRPIDYAIVSSSTTLLTTLLDAGARLENNTLNFPLHNTILRGSTACMEIILAHPSGAQLIDSFDYDGMTPLMRTAKFGDTDFSALLLQREANPFMLRDTESLGDAIGPPEDAESIARLCDHLDIAEMIRTRKISLFERNDLHKSTPAPLQASPHSPPRI